VVEEIPAYLPGGSGEHLMILVQKHGLTTRQVVDALAAHAGITARNIGTAGLKDKQALTRQWVSLPASCTERMKTFSCKGVEILEQDLHRNKLKTGHLKGNRFIIRVRDLQPEGVEDVIRRGHRLLADGVPNYFGSQRFGPGMQNLQNGMDLLKGKRKHRPGRTLRLVLNAVQSALFNDVVATRVRKGFFKKVLAGDILVKADSGGIFSCQDPAVDQERLDAGEIHVTGPMFGPRMRLPEGKSLEMETEILRASGLTVESFKKFKKLTRGTRRSQRVFPLDFNTEARPDGVILSFSLPPGAYATTLLAELVKQGV